MVKSADDFYVILLYPRLTSFIHRLRVKVEQSIHILPATPNSATDTCEKTAAKVRNGAPKQTFPT